MPAWSEVRCPNCRALLAKRETPTVTTGRIEIKCAKCNAMAYIAEEGAETPAGDPQSQTKAHR